MASNHHTIIFVPHSQAKLRKYRISQRALRAVAVVTVAFTLAVGYFTWSHFTTTIDLSQLDKLRIENERLRAVNARFETSFRSLEQQLSQFEDQTDDLAIVAGLDQVVGAVPTSRSSSSGAGGDFSTPPAAVDPSYLEHRSGRLGSRLETVASELARRDLWVSSLPSIAPVKGILTSAYGMRQDPLTGRRAFHHGIDISAQAGREVHATADGLVVKAGRTGSLGRAVYVSHGFGLLTRYGHLSEVSVQPGERVKRGSTVGFVGSSGRSTGYHLHYEIRQDNDSRNPVQYILDRSGG